MNLTNTHPTFSFFHSKRSNIFVACIAADKYAVNNFFDFVAACNTAICTNAGSPSPCSNNKQPAKDFCSSVGNVNYITSKCDAIIFSHVDACVKLAHRISTASKEFGCCFINNLSKKMNTL
jgi:hypothetical protein